MTAGSEVIADTLAMVNVVRQAYGHAPLEDLPSAVEGNSHDCLYYRALKDVGVESVSGGGGMRFASERIASHVAELWGAERDGRDVMAPQQFGQVIAAFDGRAYPQYSAGRRNE